MQLQFTREEKIEIIKKRIMYNDNSGLDPIKIAELFYELFFERNAGGSGYGSGGGGHSDKDGYSGSFITSVYSDDGGGKHGCSRCNCGPGGGYGDCKCSCHRTRK